ncbi:hypothetical protein [Actinomyces capricornis]|uniref:Uncharacterized protein n=1 Tax=Actinomyces capricornis TaxID=2755559 RepID=A0ABN6K7T8_9ACTO|nr:hypothetical protein [Actinomyces capricornis]BDA64080.1 hypothetical protein MANAM107_09140 [Actinomyces capricornis]
MRIEHRVRLAHPLAEVAAWHSRPGALTRLTPSLLATLEGRDHGGIEAGRRVGVRLGLALAGAGRRRQAALAPGACALLGGRRGLRLR